MRKDKGTMEYSLSIMLLTFTVLLLLFGFRIRSAMVEKAYIEDALAVANLASAVVDTDAYGETEKLVISDPMEAYDRFCSALKTNLDLNDSFTANTDVLMEEPVTILEFHIYNVEDAEINHIVIDEHGVITTESLPVSGVTTPNGKEIESTTVYSKIEFDVKGFLSQRFRLSLDHSVDIVKN